MFGAQAFTMNAPRKKACTEELLNTLLSKAGSDKTVDDIKAEARKAFPKAIVYSFTIGPVALLGAVYIAIQYHPNLTRTKRYSYTSIVD
jgi:hypothetical protein